MKTNVIITAQGKGSRRQETSPTFPFPFEYKQLIKVGEVPMIGRTISKCYTFGAESIKVYAHPSDCFAEAFPKIIPPNTIFEFDSLQTPGDAILLGILAMQGDWYNHPDVSTLFLLGDVVFSNTVLDCALHDEQDNDITFYGRFGANPKTGKAAKEIYALRVGCTTKAQDALRGYLLTLSQQERPGTKLWSLYHMIANHSGIRIVFRAFENDYTDDCDSWQEYEQFWKKLESCALDDDLPHD